MYTHSLCHDNGGSNEFAAFSTDLCQACDKLEEDDNMTGNVSDSVD